MFSLNKSVLDPAECRMRRLVWWAAAAFALAAFWSSAHRWADFGYRTFDLAYYVQALWKLAHGESGTVSLLNLPLLGEHANVIVLFLVPLAALCPHPLLPVAAQVLALSSMGPVAFRIARRLGLEPEPAALMALAALFTPATGFVALHEFHPEAFTAPFLLLAIDAFQRRSLPRFWLWFLATLACKENTTLLLATWCGVNAWSGWRGTAVNETQSGPGEGKLRWILRWCLLPGAVALGWAVLYAGVLAPLWNAGNIDYAGLYGKFVGVPLGGLPGAVFAQLSQSLKGNLLPGLLLPLCGLSLLRPRWLLVAAPVVAQHLLAFRASEWSIYFHYPAPLLPLVWVAACEAVAGFSARGVQRRLSYAVAGACVVAQAWVGPVRAIMNPPPRLACATSQAEGMLATVPCEASVVAGLPFLSHLAQRDHLYSLHHLLKGLKTLSLKPFQQPPPADIVMVDYADTATFDAQAGYYHPAMRVVGGLLVPSSDQLLNHYLRQASWDVESCNSLTLFRRRRIPCPAAPSSEEASTASRGPEVSSVSRIDPATELLKISAAPQLASTLLQVESQWRFSGERKAVPWMVLHLVAVQGGSETWLQRGLCVPEGWDNGVIWTDRWLVAFPGSLTSGAYRLEAVFFDNALLRWKQLKDPGAAPEFSARVSLGTVQVR